MMSPWTKGRWGSGRYRDVPRGGYDAGDEIARHYHHHNGSVAADSVNRLLYIDLKTHLCDAYMEKVDKATMACGLEARLPLLDHRLVELAFRIPGRLKIRGFSTKSIFKRAIRDLVPDATLPKHGFAVPMDPWFRGALKPFAREIVFDERTRARGYFDQAFVARSRNKPAFREPA